MTDFQLRPYQVDALDAVRRALASGKRRPVLYGPTGSGKTLLAEAVIRGSKAKGKRVLFVASRIELVGQASRHLAAAGIDHGVVQGENSRATYLGTLVCSIQTLARRGVPDSDLIVIDEAHTVPGSQAYRRMLAERPNVPVIGLTATPFARGMGKMFDGMVVSATIRELIEKGYLVDVDIYSPAEPDLTGVKVVGGDYAESELAERVDKPTLLGDIVANWIRLAQGKSTVVFATNIAHSKHIVERFTAARVPAEHLDCYTPEDERRRIIDRVASGESLVLSNVGVLAEGWDCPRVEAMILARPTRSLVRYIQMAGRVLRPYPGKTKALLLDHSGTCRRLGYPTDDLPLELDDGTPRSSGSLLVKRREATVCPKCSYVKPAGVHICPSCGFTPERRSDVKAAPGELALLRRGRATVEEKQRVYSELTSIALARGYADGWIAHKYRAYFGVWPRGLEAAPKPASAEVRNFVLGQTIRWAKGQHKREEARYAA